MRINDSILNALKSQFFNFKKQLFSSLYFVNENTNIGIIIDCNIQRSAKSLKYVEYTKEQNYFVHIHNKLLRFNIDSIEEWEEAKFELNAFLNDGVVREKLTNYGSSRDTNNPDPTEPEFTFENIFESVYGHDSLSYLKREVPFIDYEGNNRWIDYCLHTIKGKIAIEINGERFHHPGFIPKKNYKSQLFKQNSLIASGYKVYRWSSYGVKNREICAEEIIKYFGKKEDFISETGFKAERKFVSLYKHQDKIIKIINEQRKTGKNAFLVVLPTGTGKTEILIQDIINFLLENHKPKILVIVPNNALKEQMINRFKERKTELKNLSIGEEINQDIIIQTYQYMARHFYELKQDYFQYMAVDEAHHAIAPGIRKILSYFMPSSLIGLTATNERFDQQKLETIFGEYEANLSLKEAIEKNILAPIRVFRVKSNIDLSSVRYNGKDYVSSDLQKSIIIPSRDQLIVDIIKKFFIDSELKSKSGLIFCVSVKHAENMALLMQKNGISAKAVSGKSNSSIEDIKNYQKGEIQFLCTCMLLNEGWDSPRTEILVMARPTMSKVLYLQQLGRGTRKYPGKESLYVIDIVDNYGAFNAPWSAHAIFNLSSYMPWSTIIKPERTLHDSEEVILAGLYEEVRKIEEINIFTFESKYKDFLSPEQLARELFVSTGTILNRIKNKSIKPDVEVPFGNKKLFYFSHERLNEIRNQLKLKFHDESTQYEDFFEFIKEGDYTFSYKIIFLLSLLKHVDNLGECNIDILTDEYMSFYIERLKNSLPVDRENSPYNNFEYLIKKDIMKRSLLQNPFEKFERKRFVYHCTDLNLISFSNNLWEKLKNNNTDFKLIKEIMINDLIKYYDGLGGIHDLEKIKAIFNIG